MDLREFGRYAPGTVLGIRWDRGNGRLERDYVLCGFEGSSPILVYAGAIHDGNPAIFDIENTCGYLEKVFKADKRPVDSKTLSKILRHPRVN